MKHTPGPWKTKGNTRLKRGYNGEFIVETTKQVVCRIKDDLDYDSVEEAEANTKLIAAAPELLEALKETVLLLEFFSKVTNKGLEDTSPEAGIYYRANAAIKKATT